MDWIKTKSDEAAVNQGCYFEPSHAERVRHFLKKFCRQSVGAWSGRPLELLPWQWHDLILPLHGWRLPNGQRRFSHASVWVGKNNGKSTLSSGLTLYHLLADHEQGAQVINVASTVAQANDIVFRFVCDMIGQSPQLTKALRVRRNIKTVEYAKTKSTLRVQSGERGEGRRGFPISFLVFDEIAEQKTRTLFDTLSQNCKKRDNSLMLTISTAGYHPESIGAEQLAYANAILRGDIIDTSFLPVVYQARPEDDWTSEKTFQKANPSYGVTIPTKVYRELVNEARNEPRKEAAYKVERLNIYQHTASAWIATSTWDACGQPFDESMLLGKPCFCGVDLARRHDLACYVLLFNVDNLYYLLPRFFMPKDNADRKQDRDHVPYLSWEKQGLLCLTPGDVIDYAYIRQAVKDDSNKYQIQQVGYDPYNAEQLCNQQLKQEDGFDVVEIRQTYPVLAPATSQFEKVLLEKRLRHNNNPIMRWMAGNVVVRSDHQGNFLIDKQKSTSRIDGISASIMALSRALVSEASELTLITW